MVLDRANRLTVVKVSLHVGDWRGYSRSTPPRCGQAGLVPATRSTVVCRPTTGSLPPTSSRSPPLAWVKPHGYRPIPEPLTRAARDRPDDLGTLCATSSTQPVDGLGAGFEIKFENLALRHLVQELRIRRSVGSTPASRTGCCGLWGELGNGHHCGGGGAAVAALRAAFGPGPDIGSQRYEGSLARLRRAAEPSTADKGASGSVFRSGGDIDAALVVFGSRAVSPPRP